MIGKRVAIHLKHILEHIVSVAGVDGYVIDAVKLRIEVVAELLLVLGSVMLTKVLVVEEQVVGDIVSLENLVVGMYRMIDDVADALNQEQAVEIGWNPVKALVDARRKTIVDVAFLLHKPDFHAL